MVIDDKNRIFFVSDVCMVRDALLAMFSGCVDMDIIGASDDPDRVPDPAGKSLPDVIVLNMADTRTANVTALRQSLHRWPRARVIILSAYSNKTFVAEALRAGAHGYVTMQCAFQELLEAVRTVASGSTYLCSSVKQMILDGFAQAQTDTVGADEGPMTGRESTILQLFGEGQSSKEIAARLNLSSKTIDACRRQLMQKLDVDSTAGLVKCAIALGLTTIDPWAAPSK